MSEGHFQNVGLDLSTISSGAPYFRNAPTIMPYCTLIWWEAKKATKKTLIFFKKILHV
jgi:hypothetical protein